MYLKNSEIIVIKIGSSLLIDDKMNIRNKWLTEFSKDVKARRGWWFSVMFLLLILMIL